MLEYILRTTKNQQTEWSHMLYLLSKAYDSGDSETPKRYIIAMTVSQRSMFYSKWLFESMKLVISLRLLPIQSEFVGAHIPNKAEQFHFLSVRFSLLFHPAAQQFHLADGLTPRNCPHTFF